MHNHGPTCLEGPISRQRPWWKSTDSVASDSSSTTADAPEKGEGMRLDLIERVRREIAEGVYDTPEKWQLALDRLLDNLER